MNTWLQFLAQHGARLTDAGDGAAPQLAGFDGAGAAQPSPSCFIAPLTDLGLIAATGEDAPTFLHNQLTNDVENLATGQARLAGYCSPKGRLLATLTIWRSADAIMLQLPREIQPPIQKRLQMFILRAKAKLADVSDSHVVLGLAGQPAADALRAWFPELPAAPYSTATSEAGTVIRVADAFGAPRYQWITDPDTARRAWPDLTRTLPPAGPSLWRLAEIHAGIPQITKATQEQFVPQMINFELVGGVNFKKGCYPGQEIVARSQYLGKLKRRMTLASVDTGAAAGMEVFSATDPDQPAGMIVNAEPNPAGGVDCLVEVKLAALAEGNMHLGSATGPALRFASLPYTLPDGA